MDEHTPRAAAVVGVVVPTVGRWDLLEETLSSIEAQIGVRTDIAVVNDSGGPAPDWLNRRCEIVTTAGRTGEGNARMAGLEAVTADWVAFCDDDDLWVEDKLQRQLAALDGATGWCVCGATVVNAQGAPVGSWPIARVRELVQSGGLLRDLLCHNPIPAGPSSVLVSTELLRDVGGWDTGLSYFADWECWIRLAAATDPAVVPDNLTLYRQWEGQMTSDRSPAWAALDHIRTRHAGLRHALGISPLDDRVIAWILSGDLRTPGRRRAGLVDAARRLRPHRLGDLAAVPRYIPLLWERLGR